MASAIFVSSTSIKYLANLIISMIDTDTNTLYCQNKWRISFCQEWFKSSVVRHAVLISPNYWRPHWITVILDHLIPSLLLQIHGIKTKNHDHSTNKVKNLGNNCWFWNKNNTAVSAVLHSPVTGRKVTEISVIQFCNWNEKLYPGNSQVSLKQLLRRLSVCQWVCHSEDEMSRGRPLRVSFVWQVDFCK